MPFQERIDGPACPHPDARSPGVAAASPAAAVRGATAVRRATRAQEATPTPEPTPVRAVLPEDEGRRRRGPPTHQPLDAGAELTNCERSLAPIPSGLRRYADLSDGPQRRWDEAEHDSVRQVHGAEGAGFDGAGGIDPGPFQVGRHATNPAGQLGVLGRPPGHPPCAAKERSEQGERRQRLGRVVDRACPQVGTQPGR
jgi:hypothetical protein